MNGLMNKRNWWMILVAAGVLAGAVTLIQQAWLPDLAFPVFLLVMVILGIAFYWVYSFDKKGFWWALIPAMAMLVLFFTGIVGYFTPKDATNSSPWGVITLGLGALFMGWVLTHLRAKFVMYIIAVITLMVGILMLPLDLIWKLILIVVEAVAIGYLVWQTNRRLTAK